MQQEKQLKVSELRQGTELQAQVTVFNATNDGYENLALTQIVPSGWEIVNTSYVDNSSTNSSKADYIDTRDDRTNFYFGLGAKKSKNFYRKIKRFLLRRLLFTRSAS